MKEEPADLNALIDNIEASLRSSHAAQVAALKALRQLVELASHQPGAETWDRELDGSGFEDIPFEPSILTVKETAQLLRVSPAVVYELVRTRQLAALRLGSRIRIGRRGLVAYMRGMNADQFDALVRRRVEQGESKE